MKKIEKPILVTKPYLPDLNNYMQRLQSVWNTGWLTHSGPLVTELEQQLCQYLKVNDTVVFANGHLALDSALRILNLKGEVITTPFTYLSTTNAIAMNGLTPVFCDIKESDCTIDEDKIEALITENTCAILPVHVYGFPCNHEKLQKIADKYHLKLIYDAAHTFGVTVNGEGIGSLGDFSMFSFHATKVFHTVEGGAITSSNADFHKKLVSAKNFGMISNEDATTAGFNAKMTEVHAAMGLENLKLIDWEIAQRKALITRYLENLRGIDGIRLFNWDKEGVSYNYAYFPVIFNKEILGVNRDEVADKLGLEYNVFPRKYFYPLVSEMSYYSQNHVVQETPVAKYMSENVLTLPLYVELTLEEVDYICDAIKEIIG